MGDKKGLARELIVWYFRQALMHAAEGKTDWSADAEGEIATIVDLIIEAAVEEVRRQASPAVGENPTPAIDAQTLLAKYDWFAERYALDAPVAMLGWLRQAERHDDVACTRLAGVIERKVADCAVEMFEISHGILDDDTTEGDAYNKTVAEVRRIIATASFVEMMAEGIGEM